MAMTWLLDVPPHLIGVAALPFKLSLGVYTGSAARVLSSVSHVYKVQHKLALV